MSLVAFLLAHSIRIVAPGWRLAMIDRLGMTAWRGVYSVVSIATIVALIWSFGTSRSETPMLYYPPVWMAHITLTLMLVSMILLAASVLPAGRIANAVRFPALLAVKIWALAHLLANGELNSILLALGFLAWAVVARISAKRQKIAARDVVSIKWDVVAIAIGAALYAATLFYLHLWLIGVSPLAAAGM